MLDDTRRVTPHGNRRTFHPRPRAHATTPPDNRMHHTRIVPDLRVLEHNRVLDPHATANHHPRPDRDIRPQFRGRVDRRRRVDVHGRHDGRRGRGEFLRLRLEGLLQVQRVSGDSGTGGFDLAPEVLCLVDEEAVAIREVGEDVLFQTEDFALRRVVVVGVGGGDKRSFEVLGGRVGDETGAGGAAFDGAADSGEDALGCEEVDAAVDEVGDVRFGFFDVVQDPAGV